MTEYQLPEPAMHLPYGKHVFEHSGATMPFYTVNQLREAYAKGREDALKEPSEPKSPEFFAQLEYNTPDWDVVVCVYQRVADAPPLLVHRESLPRQIKEPSAEIVPSWLLKSTQEFALNLAKRVYPEVTQFEVLDDLAGVISQIDNITCGMERKRDKIKDRQRDSRGEGMSKIMELADAYAKAQSEYLLYKSPGKKQFNEAHAALAAAVQELEAERDSWKKEFAEAFRHGTDSYSELLLKYGELEAENTKLLEALKEAVDGMGGSYSIWSVKARAVIAEAVEGTLIPLYALDKPACPQCGAPKQAKETT